MTHAAGNRNDTRWKAALVCAWLALVGCGPRSPDADARPASASESGPSATDKLVDTDFTTFSDLADSPLNEMPKMDAWRQEVPGIREIEIPSSSGGEAQPALFYDSGSDRPRPLLMALHSWTSDYQKQFSIPYGVWATKNDWVLMHADFGGEFDDPAAALSEGAVEDILDALEWARNNARIDEERIYLTGFSGGAMAALTMVGRYPDKWTAAVAWVPVFDLVDWYATIRHHDMHYAPDIEAICGGPPVSGTRAEEECRKRSPSSYLAKARGHDVRVLIAAGIEDWFVPPRHALEAFNALADPADRLSEQQIERISSDGVVPPDLESAKPYPRVSAAGRKILGERESAGAVLWIFDGSHDVIYNAGLAWLAEQRGP